GGWEGGPADGKLVRGELAHHDGAGGLEALGHHGVLRRHVLDQHLGVRRGGHPGAVDDVLKARRNAVQRPPPIATGDFLLRLTGPRQRKIWGQADEGVIAAVEPAGALEERRNVLYRGELARTDQILRIVEAVKCQVRTGSLA